MEVTHPEEHGAFNARTSNSSGSHRPAEGDEAERLRPPRFVMPKRHPQVTLLGEQLHQEPPQRRARRSVQSGGVPLPHEGECARIDGRVYLRMHVVGDEALDMPRVLLPLRGPLFSHAQHDAPALVPAVLREVRVRWPLSGHIDQG